MSNVKQLRHLQRHLLECQVPSISVDQLTEMYAVSFFFGRDILLLKNKTKNTFILFIILSSFFLTWQYSFSFQFKFSFFCFSVQTYFSLLIFILVSVLVYYPGPEQF